MHCFRSPIGGLFRHVRDLVRAQNDAGHQTGIICDLTTGGPFEDAMLAELAPELPLGLRRIAMQRHISLRDLPAIRAVHRTIAPLRADVLHGHGAKGGFYARLAGTLLRRADGSRPARIYSPHGGSLHYDPRSTAGRLIFSVERLAERFTDHILFVSRHEAGAYQRKVGTPRRPSAVIENGLHPEEFASVAPAADAADFLFIGMMRKIKGPDLFLQALHQGARLVGRSLTGVMVGDGELLERCRHDAARLGLSVRFMPPMPAREAMRLARTLVVPSRAEAMPYIVLEALAASMPLIATRTGGIPEIFGDRASILCDPDILPIASRMAEAASHLPGYAARMPAAAEIAERFSATSMARRVESAYDKALYKT